MKLSVQLKLLPTLEQAEALRRTLETANAACDYISQVAWETKTFRQFPIHRLTYAAVRETFGLAAQLAVRCIARVADAYKLDKETNSSVVNASASCLRGGAEKPIWRWCVASGICWRPAKSKPLSR
jgi:predicted transposase